MSDKILDKLDQGDFNGARDELIKNVLDATTDFNSWDSPQYRTNKEVQESIVLDYSRCVLLTYFGLEVLMDRYVLRNGKDPVEDPQKFYARIATGLACEELKSDNSNIGDVKIFAQKLYDYMSLHWFSPATPVLTNIGTNRGLPISCFLNQVDDSIEGIFSAYTENGFLSKGGGGIGTYWGKLRHGEAKLSTGGKSSGIIPFLKVMDSATLAVSQGGVRRGAAAVYLDVWHPEIEDFIEIRKPTGGDENRRCMNLHHGVAIDDEFMLAVENRSTYWLKNPHTGENVKEINAFEFFKRMIALRMETGEPYMLFIDNVKKATPEHHILKNLYCQQSNLCSEITLPTSSERTAVCCLGSVNFEKLDEWQGDEEFVYNCVRALDNVLDAFIRTANPNKYPKSIFSAKNERSIGLGVMGYHGMLMKNRIPFESVQARLLNRKLFKELHEKAILASVRLGEERGICPDAIGTNFKQRNSYVMAIAPTANISVIAGNSTPCIEPISGNAYLQKTLSGSYLVKNRYLEDCLQGYGKNDLATWKSIISNEGSVLQLDFLTEEEKNVFKTGFEINQRELVQQTADRTKYICQAQSTNLFFDVPVKMSYLYDAHFKAWKEGCKSLYYLRSKSIIKADSVEREAVRKKIEIEECAVCQ